MKKSLHIMFQKIWKKIIWLETTIYGTYQNFMKKHRLLHNIKLFLRKLSFKSVFLIILSLGFLGVSSLVLWFALTEIPDASSFSNRRLSESTKIFDRTGKVLLYDLSQNIRRTSIPLSDMSPFIEKATLAIEDADFYTHNGIKLDAIIRAVLTNIISLEAAQGGSTITQQLVKKSLLTDKKVITRKIKEWILALKIEKVLSKKEILERYLNEMPYGGTVYGVEEASQTFFGKSAKDVSLSESAYLAAVLKGPTYYSPYGKRREELENRKNLVLSRMKELNFISEKEYKEAVSERFEFKEKFGGGIKAPHFVMFIRDYLEENYGEKMLEGGGLTVTTTLDYDLQKKAEEIVKEYTLKNAKENNAKNSALVAMDAKTSELLVMVGSRDYFDEEIDGNFNVATAKRQPGSSFKPFVYAGLFEKGYRPETVVFDTETQFGNNCEMYDFRDAPGCYSPQNYDGKFRGPMSLRNALAQSINIPAVKGLYLLGIQNALSLTKDMGISTLTTPEQYGLTLVLGGGEVTLLDMTSAYSVFAAEGEKRPITSILKIEDKAGNIIEEKKDVVKNVLSEDTALLISDVLSDNQARTPIFGAGSSLYFPGKDVAAKTGTTNDYRDAWVIGYTPQIVVGAWTGNNDNSPINRKVAGYIVAPMWHRFMEEVFKTMPDEKFKEPAYKDLTDVKPIIRGVWNRGSDTHDILHFVDKNNPLGPEPQIPQNDFQYGRWEYGVQKWIGQNGDKVITTDIIKNPPVAAPEVLVGFVSPQDQAVFKKNTKPTIQIEVSSKDPVSKVEYFINNNSIGVSNESPYELSFFPNETPGIKDVGNILKAKVTTASNKESEAFISFGIK
jgi:1A family penicillin-binding protein